MIGHPSQQLFEEVAYIAYHFHWSRVEVMEMDHLERHRWVAEIAHINERLNDAAGVESEQWPG
jgi:hypothetical protein